MTWEAVPAMQEDGLHGVDGWRVARGTEIADDSFFSYKEDAEHMADTLNKEDEA